MGKRERESLLLPSSPSLLFFVLSLSPPFTLSRLCIEWKVKGGNEFVWENEKREGVLTIFFHHCHIFLSPFF